MTAVTTTDVLSTLQEAQQIMSECFTDYVETKFASVQLSSAKYYFGQVSYNRRTKAYTLKISRPIFSSFDTVTHMKKKLLNTLIHELIHTCPNCMNHGMDFKRRAWRVYTQTGIRIERVSDQNSVEGLNTAAEALKRRETKYQIYCPHCQQVVAERTKYSKVCAQLHKYMCHKCGCKTLELHLK